MFDKWIGQKKVIAKVSSDKLHPSHRRSNFHMTVKHSECRNSISLLIHKCVAVIDTHRAKSREGRAGQGEYKLKKVTCQQPRSTPVEVKTTLSRTIFRGQRPSATALTAATSASIYTKQKRIQWLHQNSSKKS